MSLIGPEEMEILTLKARVERLEQQLLADKQPEPRWKDVTAECEMVSKDGIGDQVSVRHHAEVVVYTNPGSPYRLRKVVVHIEGFPRYAFIIEKEDA